MKFNTNFLKNYLELAPIPLALERTLECEILSKEILYVRIVFSE